MQKKSTILLPQEVFNPFQTRFDIDVVNGLKPFFDLYRLQNFKNLDFFFPKIKNISSKHPYIQADFSDSTFTRAPADLKDKYSLPGVIAYLISLRAYGSPSKKDCNEYVLKSFDKKLETLAKKTKIQDSPKKSKSSKKNKKTDLP